MKYEEQLLCLISLAEKDVVVKHIHNLEFWNQIDKKIRSLVLEEPYAINDLTMSRLNDISSKLRRQIVK